MVAEADESDRSFLKLSPSIAVITNIDHEHLESYGSFDDLQQAFVDFANKVPFYGAVVACADDPHLVRGAAAAARGASSPTASTDPTANFAGTDVARRNASGGRCVVHRRREGATERARHARR